MKEEEINMAIAAAIGEMYYQYEPNYCGDLNTMAHAEKVIPKENLDNYHYHLSGIVSDWKGGVKQSVYKSVFATASQRAEAFLKTLNLWKE